MAILYKGAGPGTHWCINDARKTGFSSASNLLHSANLVIRHIQNYSHPSPYVSATASYAIAWDYAREGPTGTASKKNPGYVYEIDPTTADRPELIDPICEIAKLLPGGLKILTDHDGDKNLILALAAPSLFPIVLVTPPLRVGSAPGTGPRVTPELSALIRALRDAEVLVQRVQAACVVGRHKVT